MTVAALTVTVAVPVEDKVTDCVAGVFRLTLPNVRLVALMLSVGTPAPNCRAKVFATPPALAVNVTVCAELNAETVAVKLAPLAVAGTVTVTGTATALLLLARLTVNPPAGAAEFRVTVQLSAPAPVIDPLLQLSPLNTVMPVPLRVIKVEVPVEELLVSVS